MIKSTSKKKKSKDSLADDGGYLYDRKLFGVGVSGTSEDPDHVTSKALEELVFGKQVSFKRARESSESEDGSEDEVPDKYNTSDLQRESAWVDEDDETVSVDISSKDRLKKLRHSEEEKSVSGVAFQSRLRSQFEKLSRQPDWAKPQSSKKKKKYYGTSSDPVSSSDEEDDDILRQAGQVVDTTRQSHLLQGFVNIKKLKDPNRGCRPDAVIQSLEFHPSAYVMLTAGYHKSLDLFQVDGQSNPKLHSIHIEHFPISMAHFSVDGNEIIMTGYHKKAFHVFNIPSSKVTKVPGIRGRNEKFYTNFKVSPDGNYLAFLGTDGYIILVSSKTKQWVADLKMNGSVRDVDFTSDGKHMLSFGSDGEVYIWDLANRSCVHKFVDEGCILGTAIATSSNSNYIACGCSSGIVNVYDSTCLHKSRPTPLKSLTHLTTAVDQVKFNPTSEILAISSKRNKAALRLVHLPSLTVFPNWPTSRSSLNYCTVMDFSTDSKYFGVGNDKGRALLYRLNHYRNS